MGEDREAKVLRWLQSEGYPLEMKVARILRGAGFEVVQSEYYEDPSDNTPREIDVRAWKEFLVGADLLRLTLCVECKVEKRRPWVVFTSDRASPGPWFHVFYSPASRFGREFLTRIAPQVPTLSFFAPADFRLVGHAITAGSYCPREKNETGKDTAYHSVVSTSRAAHSIAAQGDGGSSSLAEIVLPVVVVDGGLFRAHMDENFELQVQSVQQSTIVLRRPIADLPMTVIRVIQVDALAEAAKAWNRDSEELRGFSDELAEAHHAMRARLLVDAAAPITEPNKVLIEVKARFMELCEGARDREIPSPQEVVDWLNEVEGVSGLRSHAKKKLSRIVENRRAKTKKAGDSHAPSSMQLSIQDVESFARSLNAEDVLASLDRE